MKLDTYSPPGENIKELFRSMGGDDFDRMRTYLFDMHNSMQNQKHLLQKSYEEELKLFPNAVELTTRVHRQYQENYDTHFVGVLLNSSLAASYSLFEVTFKKVCHYVADKNRIPLKKDDFGIAGIVDKCKNFIATETTVNLPEIEQYWNRLLLFRQARNKIVHHAAMIPSDNKVLLEFLREGNYVHIYHDGNTNEFTFYIKDRLFVYDFLEISSSYLIWILMRL